jgi:hypothetical protein
MIIKNISGAAISIVEVGKIMQHNDLLEVDDALRKDDGIDKLITDGKLQVMSFSSAETSGVQQEELDAVAAAGTAHASSDGTSHANVGLNDTHRTGDGSDHADVAANTSAIAALEPHVVTEHQTQATAVPGPTLRPLLIMDRPGTIVNFLVNAVTPANPGEDTTIDLLVNGGSILAAPIVINNAVPPLVPVPGTIAVPVLAPMDRVDIVFTYTPGGGPAPMADVSGTVWITV